MKKWIKIFTISIRNTVILFFILEIFLHFLFQYNDENRFHKNVDFKIASGAYQDIDPEIIKEMYDELHRLDTEWAPYIYYKLKEFDEKYHHINANGIRKTVNFNQKNRASAFKVFCFGGSTLFGTGTREQHTIPSRLSHYIHQNFPKKNIEITNFGCHGYTRSIENIQLQREILKNNIPDLVIFYDGVNEVISAFENNEADLPASSFNRRKEFRISNYYGRKISMLYSSSNIKRLVTYLQKKVFKTKPMQVSDPENLSTQIALQHIRSFEITKALGKQYNFKVYNFLQPMIFLDKPLTKPEKIMAKDNSHFRSLYINTYRDILKQTELRKDSTFTDISSIFIEDTNTIYTDFCHIAERGNDSIAKKIFSYITPSIAKGNESKTTNIQTETLQSFQ
ncbi:hypothetical protein [uncultured Aquimarina sp.]|uniref:SGNH/GDSL hydrolase family protein n=1 Tax=uncultured Aquimarina sp. TaxID=575652 RepID=UPI002606C33B|nr:hypothetical protein [uncultured Aquimarina sp.]